MIVRAKRAGYSEEVKPEDFYDLETYEEHEHEGDDLEGEYEKVTFTMHGKQRVMHLVGGQEADPSTIEEVE